MFSKSGFSARLRESSLENRKAFGEFGETQGPSLLLILLPVGGRGSGFLPESAVNTTQLTAWLTGGISSTRLVQLIHERGLAVAPTENGATSAFRPSGADQKLVRTLAEVNPADSRSQRTSIPAAAPTGCCRCSCTALSRSRTAVACSSANRPSESGHTFRTGRDVSPAGAMGRRLRRAHDIGAAHAGFPENHSSLSYVSTGVGRWAPMRSLRREPRLSMDPENAEAVPIPRSRSLFKTANMLQRSCPYRVSGSRSGRSRHLLRHGHCPAC